jgi:hypothetical protein
MSRKENDPDTAEVYTHTVGGPMPHLDPGYNAARQAAHAWMDEHGWDTKGRIEIPVAWGQQDIFKYVARCSQGSRFASPVQGDIETKAEAVVLR